MVNGKIDPMRDNRSRRPCFIAIFYSPFTVFHHSPSFTIYPSPLYHSPLFLDAVKGAYASVDGRIAKIFFNSQ